MEIIQEKMNNIPNKNKYPYYTIIDKTWDNNIEDGFNHLNLFKMITWCTDEYGTNWEWNRLEGSSNKSYWAFSIKENLVKFILRWG